MADITADVKNRLANYLPEKMVECAEKKPRKPDSRAKSKDYALVPSYLMGSLCSDEEVELKIIVRKVTVIV